MIKSSPLVIANAALVSFLTLAFFPPLAIAVNPLCTAVGATQAELFGFSLVALDDISGDHIPDFVVGSPLADVGSCTACGKITIISGADCSTLQTINGVAGGQYFGSTMVRLPDVNGDQIADFIVAALGHYDTQNPNNNRYSYIQTFSGANRSVLYSIGLPPNTNYQEMGRYLSVIRDANADGKSDFMLSVKDAFNGILVYSGASGSFIAEHNVNFSPFFFPGSGVQPYTSPSTSDIILSNGSSVYFAIRTAANPANGIPGFCVYGINPANQACFDGPEYAKPNGIFTVGDINHDGYNEIAVSTTSYKVGNSEEFGALRVYSGKQPDFKPMFVIETKAVEQNYAIRAISIPDADFDTISDILVSATGNGGPPVYPLTMAYVEVISGFDGESVYKISGEWLGDGFGSQTSSIGDVNGDGFSDFIISSNQQTPPRGRVQLFAGPRGDELTNCDHFRIGDTTVCF